MAKEATTDGIWTRLAAPFPTDDIELKPQPLTKDEHAPKERCDGNRRVSVDGRACGGYHARAVHLDYVGHAGITTRLNEVVSPDGWEWDFAHRDVPAHILPLVHAAVESGNTELVTMLLDRFSQPVYRDDGLWIKLTIDGTTKYGFGDAQGKRGPNAVKEIIGDGIRNAALRFGIGTYLWSKSEAAKALREGRSAESDEVVTDVEQLPSEGELWHQISVALRSKDPEAQLNSLMNHHGRAVLERVQVTTKAGDRISGLQAIEAALRHAHDPVPVAPEGTVKPVATVAPDPPGYFPPKRPSAISEPEAQPQQASLEVGVVGDYAHWNTELAFQASELGVNPREYGIALLDGSGTTRPTDLKIGEYARRIVAGRQSVADVLEGKGLHPRAAKYRNHPANKPIAEADLKDIQVAGVRKGIS